MSFFKGILFGAVVGSAAGLLLAPRKGSETQEKLVDDVRDIVERTDAFNDSLGDFREALVEVKETFNTLVPEFTAGIEKDIEDFRFQAEPRIKEIQAEIDDLTKQINS